MTTFFGVFFVEMGRDDPNLLLASHHQPTRETPFKWHFAGVPMTVNIEYLLGSFVFFRGSRPVLLTKNTYIFAIFQWGSGHSVPTSGSAHDTHRPLNQDTASNMCGSRWGHGPGPSEKSQVTMGILRNTGMGASRNNWTPRVQLFLEGGPYRPL